jgi:hypothetical protein
VRRIGDAIPHERLLRDGAGLVVVAVEWCERRQLHSSVTELFICIRFESARIRADEWNLEHLVLEDPLNR